MTRLIGHMVVRDEGDRYFPHTIGRACQIFDQVVVYDDGSTDRTMDIAVAASAAVLRRPDTVPSFREDESACRQAAWQALGNFVSDDDWVVCLDADEILALDLGDRRSYDTALHAGPEIVRNWLNTNLVDAAIAEGFQKINLQVIEGWGWDDTDRLLVRTDGDWGNIRGDRISRWEHGQKFRAKPWGCGSVPLGGRILRAINPIVVHYGYCRPADQRIKYMTHRDRLGVRGGHARDHVESILHPGRLSPREVIHGI